MSKNVSKVVVLSSSTAERIGDANKMKIVVNAAVLDIESNFLPLEVMDIYINNQLVDTTTSDESGELTMTLQWDYHGDTEVIIQAEHKASGQKSLKKILPLKGQLPNLTPAIAEEKIAETYGSPISKWAVIAAVKKNGLSLGDIKFAHHVDDVAVVTEAVKQNGLALEFASERLKKDIAIFNIAVEQNGDAASFAEEELYKKYITALENAKLHGKVTSQFNDTKPLVALAIKTNTNDFKNISDRLKDDENIVRLAVEKDGSLLQYASLNLKKNKDIVLLAIENMPNSILYADMAIQSDESIATIAIKRKPELIKKMPDTIKNIIWLGIVVVQADGLLLQYLSMDLKNNKKIVSIAVKSNNDAFKFASEELRSSKLFVLELLQYDYSTIKHVSHHLKNSDADILYLRIKNWDSPSIIPDSLRDDKKFMLKVITDSGHWSLQYASQTLLQDKDIVLAEIKKGNAYLGREQKDLKIELYFRPLFLYTTFYNNWTKQTTCLCNMDEFVWYKYSTPSIEIAIALIKNDYLNIDRMATYRTRNKFVMIEVVKSTGTMYKVHSTLMNDPEIKKAAWQ